MPIVYGAPPAVATPAERMPPRRPTARLAVACLACGAVVGLGPSACGTAPRAFGPTAAVARTHADEFFAGLALRFVDVQRTPHFAAARQKLARYALTPARLYADSAVWTSTPADGTRWLELTGRVDAGRYLFAAQPGAPAPLRPAEARHVMRLVPQGDGAFRWNTAVEHAVGRVRADAVVAALTDALARLESPGGEVRAELRQALPRSTAAFGRLFTLDSVRSAPLPDGSHLVDLRVSLHPERLRATMPAFAQYVEKYVAPARYHIVVGDARGGRWIDATARRNVLTFRMRLRDGRLLAFDGAARPLPERFELRVDATARFLVFDVGVSDLVGDVAAVRTTNERGWTVRWRRAPRWHLPLATRHLVSGALQRPFADEGMRLHLTLRDHEAGQTLVVRRFDVSVQESALVRWLGGLGFRAMDDFAGRAEAEENRFLAEALLALRTDVTRTLGS